MRLKSLSKRNSPECNYCSPFGPKPQRRRATNFCLKRHAGVVFLGDGQVYGVVRKRYLMYFCILLFNVAVCVHC
ncbi:hypothetical protein ANPL_00835 [Anaplasma platys]|uniref:Uncharacterized protein n=1 Tax=Anaplasma platys TaxID=949 RepID=A0A858PXG2_9RICK|nr:hypothetical protein ANPL_00835 [Anaplasma platys]